VLVESIIRIGRPIVESDLPCKERIRWLTDVSSENCKNYFKNVFLVELGENEDAFHHMEIGEIVKVNKKESFYVDQKRNVAFPVIYPNGGNPLKAQGVYPVPCYLMYDPHIKSMNKPDEFMKKDLLPRLEKTVSYQNWKSEEKEKLAERIVKVINKYADNYIYEEKQLGVLMVFDNKLSVYKKSDTTNENNYYIWITESRLKSGQHLYLNGEEVLKGIVEARFDEASSLGEEKNAVSTFSNKPADKVVSIYNKSWLWLSPTWEMSRSIYWKKNEWTKGIKIDRNEYEAFLFGAQFLKQIQVPISSSVLKEMFAPIENAEAKRNKKATSFEPIFGIPMVLPLLDGDSKQIYEKFRRMLKKDKELRLTDLHLEVLAGLKESIVPDSSDNYRLTILYYSGDLSRGAMHIRAVIEDVIPSVANSVQKILRKLKTTGIKEIQKHFGIENYRTYKIETLPSLLGNAFGSGYLWSSLQAALHRKSLKADRLSLAMMKKLNELANKEDYWGMKQELIFYYSFLYFLKRYEENILGNERSVNELADWQCLIDSYHEGNIELEDLNSPDSLGFIVGMLLKQFSNSYYQKTNKDYVKTRVMRFGSKLTPEMVWKNGVLRCEELAGQWDMGLKKNCRKVLSQVLLGFIEAEQQQWLTAEKERFMTAFWSGYLIYKKPEEVEVNGN
jgi:hypothetical protein